MSAPQPKSDFVLRIIAIYKLATAALFIAAGFGMLHLLNKDVADWLLQVLRFSRIDPNNPKDHVVHWCLEQAGLLTKGKLEALSAVAFFYAGLFTLEGLGLYFHKRWAEYLVVILTASLLPVEFYELYRSVSTIKLVILSGNLAILAYLIYVLFATKKKS